MDKEIIEKFLLEISTPTGLTYSGDTTICNDEVKYIMNYINDLEQQVKKQKEVIDKAIEYLEQKPVVMVNGEPREIYVEDDNKLLDILKKVE